MRRFRRVVQTFVATWSAGMLVKIMGWVLPMSNGLQAVLAVVAMTIGGVIGWRESRQVEPFTPQDIRDGAVGYGIVVMLIVPLTAGAAAEMAGTAFIAPAAIGAALAVLASVTYVHRSADRFGVDDPDQQPTDEFPRIDERGLAS